MARVLMFWRAIDQQRFHGMEEMPRRIGNEMMRFLTFAKLSAQVFQERCCPWLCGAAGFQPFKLDEKATARLRRQLPQIVANPIGLDHHTRLRST
jgi:hypothetical protein